MNGKIRADNFIQKKGAEHTETKHPSAPVLNLPVVEQFNLTEDEVKRLSEIIDEINSRTGNRYDGDVAIKALLQIRDLLKKSEPLRAYAKTNTEQDFAFPYYENADDILIEGLSQNQDFFTLLLNNDDIKKRMLGTFLPEIYKELRRE